MRTTAKRRRRALHSRLDRQNWSIPRGERGLNRYVPQGVPWVSLVRAAGTFRARTSAETGSVRAVREGSWTVFRDFFRRIGQKVSPLCIGHFKRAKTVRKRPQTTKGDPRTVMSTVSAGRDRRAGAGGEREACRRQIQTQKTAFLRRFSAVLADSSSKRIVTARCRWW